MKIFITGVAGFIGSSLAEELLLRGHKVVGVDDFSFGTKENFNRLSYIGFSNFEFHEIDISKGYFGPMMKGCDMIFHLAAYKIPRYGDTYTSLRTNIFGSHNVLKDAKGIPVILASTSDVYGKGTPPFKETDDLVIGPPESRRWSYAASKIIDEHMTIAFYEKFKQKYNIIRFFNVYGSHCALDWTGGAVPQIINKIIRKKTVEIHGDGKQTRCYIHINDVVRGLIKLISSGKWNEIINIGSTQSISVNKLVDMIYDIEDVKKSDRKIKYIPYTNFFGKYQDVAKRKPDISKARKLLDWKPVVGLKIGLRRTIEWQRTVRQK